jgi:hypothetical protein
MRPEEARYLAQRLAQAERGIARPRQTGINRRVRTCARCGKTGLDKTIEIKMPNGEVLHYGTECAGFIMQNDSAHMPEEHEDESEYEDDAEDGDGAEVDEEEDIEEEIVPFSRYEPKGYQHYRSEDVPIPPLPHAADDLSAENFDARYQIGDVIFDASNGIGNVPNNRNVRHLGFGAIVKPSKFLVLCPSLDTESERPDPLYVLEEGRLNPGWAPPILYIDTTDALVTGHEGRHRCKAFESINPKESILVHFFLKGGFRARNLNKEILKKINEGLFNQSFFNELTSEQMKDPEQKKKYFVKGPIFSEVFLGRERIKM